MSHEPPHQTPSEPIRELARVPSPAQSDTRYLGCESDNYLVSQSVLKELKNVKIIADIYKLVNI